MKPTKPLNTLAIIVVALLVAVVVFPSGLGNWAAHLKDSPFKEPLVKLVAGPVAALESLPIWGPINTLQTGFRQAAQKPLWPAMVSPSPAPSPVPAKPVYDNQHPLRVLMVGDSMAGLDTAAAFRYYDKQLDYLTVDISYKISSTFSDPTIFDWTAEIGPILAGKSYDAVIVLLGSNDAQSIWIKGQPLAFNTPEWDQIYNDRAKRFLATVTSQAKQVYWVSVPPMRLAGYKDRMVLVNQKMRRLVAAYPTLRFIDLADFLGNPQGGYAETGLVDGRQAVLRSVDGIHLSFAGAEVFFKHWLDLASQDFGLIINQK